MFLLYDITGTQTLQLFKFFLHIILTFITKDCALIMHPCKSHSEFLTSEPSSISVYHPRLFSAQLYDDVAQRFFMRIKTIESLITLQMWKSLEIRALGEVLMLLS